MTNNSNPLADPNAKMIGQPIACQLDIVPIFPVRFSLTAKALDNAAKTGAVPLMPTGITDPNYDLRRLRQGYLYILARVKHVGNATDEKKRWLVFEYTVANDDSNAPKLNGSGLPYRFAQYVWADGTARGEWKKLPQSLPYAYVHSQVGAIECAYSEVRWTAEMFEALERNAQKRAKIMQKISLGGGASNFIFPGAQLAEKVADFQPAKATQDKADSYRRATGIGYHQTHKVFDNCSAKKTVVIALFDRIADAKDIAAYHQIILANNEKEFAKILYPVTTAKAIQQIEQHVYKNPNRFKRLMSSDPLDKGMREQIKLYAQKSPLMSEQTMKHLATAQFNLLNQTGNGTSLTHLDFLQELCQANMQQADKLASVTDYAMAYYGTAMAGMGDTPKGMEYQKNLLLTQNPWGSHLANLLTFGDKLNQIIKEGAAYKVNKTVRFDVMVTSIMAAQMSLWKEEHLPGVIPYAHYLGAVGLKPTVIPKSYQGGLEGAVEVVNQQMRTLIKNANALFKDLSAAHYQTELSKYIRAGSSHYINIRVHVVVKNEYNPAQRLLKINESVGTFLAGGALILNLREWASYKSDNANAASAWFLHPATRLTNDFAALVGSLERSKGALSQFYEKIDGATAKQIYGLAGFKQPIGIPAKVGRGIALPKFLSFKNIGRFANVLGVAIAYAQVQQAARTGNTAARNSAIMAGLAEISFLISTFAYTGALVGVGVVLAIGAVLTSLVADNEFEQWVRTGFWGNSGEYWGKRRLKLLERFETAEKLASLKQDDETREIKTFFEKEMDGFYNLVWGIGIDTSQANQYRLKVYCPAFKDRSSADKLTVAIEYQDYSEPTMMPSSGIQPPVTIPNTGMRKQFIRQGEILIDLSAINMVKSYRYNANSKEGNIMDTLTVKIKYPKLGEDISTPWNRSKADYFETQIIYTGVK